MRPMGCYIWSSCRAPWVLFIMADTLDFKFFEPHVDGHFQVDGGPMLKLVECKQLKSVPGEPREPFSLLFQGPAAPILEQKIYALENEQAGRIEIFLVPVGRDAS